MRGRKAVWAVVLGCLAVGGFYAERSAGTYQDDDVDRYYLARQVWKEPSLLLDTWGMPVPAAVFAAPARWAGYRGVEWSNVVATAAAAGAAGVTAATLGLAAPWVAAVFFFFQPLVLELSYSALAEPLAALLLSLALWAWYAGRLRGALWLAGLMPLARIDAGVLAAVFLAAGWRRTGWGGRVGVAVPVLLWNLAGALRTKDPLFVLTSAARPFTSLGPWHYLQNAVVTVGAVVLFFFLWAVAARASNRGSRPTPRFPDLAAVLVGVHWLVLMLLAWEWIPVGRSTGFLRHTLASAPALALVAAWGMDDWRRGAVRHRLRRWLPALLWTAAVAGWFSHELVAHSFLGEGRVEHRWIFSLGLTALGGWALLRPGPKRGWPVLAAALAVGLALATVRPIGLNPERAAVQTVVERLEGWGLESSVVYTNHPWFPFLSGRDRYDVAHTPPLTHRSLESAPPGSLVLWENHYGNRLYGDVEVEELRADPRFRRLLEMSAGTERNFRIVLFQRVS